MLTVRQGSGASGNTNRPLWCELNQRNMCVTPTKDTRHEIWWWWWWWWWWYKCDLVPGAIRRPQAPVGCHNQNKKL